MSVPTTLGLRRVTRIIAIPLSRPLPAAATTSTPTTLVKPGLTYYQFHLTSDDPERVEQMMRNTKVPRWIANLTTKIRTTARNTWVSFGKAPGGWKLRTYKFGERIVDRMDFEELALRTVDPNLSPWPRKSFNPFTSVEKLRIPILYPPSIVTEDAVMSELQQHVEERITVHKRRMYFWMLIAPLTAPFMIIPIVPNLPFIFCVWRSITHWETLHASRYLKLLMDKDCIVPESDDSLNAAYKEHTLASEFSTTPGSNQRLLLTEDAVPEIVGRFDLDETAKVDLTRAVGQARERNESGKLG